MSRMGVLFLMTIACQFPWRVGLAFQVEAPILEGCHERFTYQAVQAAKSTPGMPAEATLDDEVLASGLQYNKKGIYPIDRLTISLLEGARYNDLHGQSCLSIDNLAEVHNEPEYQREHCLRQEYQDGNEGAGAALEDCRQFIVERVAHAFGGLDVPDPWVMEEIEMYLRFRGTAMVSLSRLYFNLGRALHTVQDSFSHTFRTSDGMRIVEVFNWMEELDGSLQIERDGYPHVSVTDQCSCGGPTYDHVLALTRQASVEFLDAVLGAENRPQREEQLVLFLEKWMSFESGCSLENNFCQAPLFEELVQGSITCPGHAGCSCRQSSSGSSLWGLGLVLLVGFFFRGKRRWFFSAVLLCWMPLQAQAQSVFPETMSSCQEPMAEPGVYLGFRTGITTDRPAMSFEASSWIRGETWGFALAIDYNPFFSFERGLEASAGTLNIVPGLTIHFQLTERLSMRFEVRLGLSVLLFNTVGYKSGTLGLLLGARAVGLDYRLLKNLYLTIDPLDVALPVFSIDKMPFYYKQVRSGAGLVWRF